MLQKSSYFLLLFWLMWAQCVFGQFVTETESPANAKINRDRGLSMLWQIKEVIELNYYDKTYLGMDLDAKFKAAAEMIKKLDANRQIYSVIAQLVLDFNDSHTTFLPPGRANQVEYGFSLQMIGNKCHVIDVKKGSDAEAKGLKIGDVVISIGTISPTRENLWKINYLIYALDPQDIISLKIADPAAHTRISRSRRFLNRSPKEGRKRKSDGKKSAKIRINAKR
jgi:C-terminal processing protease CtpA/Prc